MNTLTKIVQQHMTEKLQPKDWLNSWELWTMTQRQSFYSTLPLVHHEILEMKDILQSY